MYTSTVTVKPDDNFPEIPVCTIQFFKDGVPFGGIEVARGYDRDQLTRHCREKIREFTKADAQKAGMADLIAHPPVGEIDISEAISPEMQVDIALTEASQAKHIEELSASTDPDVVAAMTKVRDIKSKIIPTEAIEI